MWTLQKGVKLVHIDQHSDMNANDFFLENETWEDVVSFTNEKCNVWNFILPALHSHLIDDIEQIRTEQKLLFYLGEHYPYILDIDLDFWDPKMGIQDYKWTLYKVKKLMGNAILVTIATSPYFLDQEYAIDLAKSLLEV